MPRSVCQTTGAPVRASPTVHTTAAAPGVPREMEEQPDEDEEESAGREEVDAAAAIED